MQSGCIAMNVVNFGSQLRKTISEQIGYHSGLSARYSELGPHCRNGTEYMQIGALTCSGSDCGDVVGVVIMVMGDVVQSLARDISK